GFGSDGLLFPVPFGAGEESRQFAWTYRVVPDGDLWVMQSLRGETWTDLYAFTLEPQFPIDFEMANHFTATYPESRFLKTLTVQVLSPEVRYALRNRELMIDRGGDVTTQTLADASEIAA